MTPTLYRRRSRTDLPNLVIVSILAEDHGDRQFKMKRLLTGLSVIKKPRQSTSLLGLAGREK